MYPAAGVTVASPVTAPGGRGGRRLIVGAIRGSFTCNGRRTHHGAEGGGLAVEKVESEPREHPDHRRHVRVHLSAPPGSNDKSTEEGRALTVARAAMPSEALSAEPPLKPFLRARSWKDFG